ncbi:enoyl-CoA hydratase [Isoalcanivorax beigongshangi]|uniref:Enoyl-CoA hydratase n=1 Tax=Isoalcanivorax beigongshangi TaxID=3238810 RepID=A0ABV4AJ83_9GAMM
MTISSSCADIAIEQRGQVLELHMQRPERKNALTHAMYTALNAALRAADEDSSVRVVLITGTDDCFTAGNDMSDFLQHPPSGPDAPVMQFLELLRTFRKPLVAAVNGAAIGVGTTMLLHCDLVYCGRSARLQMPFVSLGLCPEAGSSFLLAQAIGPAKAAELLLLAETITGERALELGIANGVCDDANYLAKARGAAERLAAMPPASVRLTKELMRAPHAEVLAAQMAREGAEFVQRLTSPEAREAMTAFVEKRAPDFSRFD